MNQPPTNPPTVYIAFRQVEPSPIWEHDIRQAFAGLLGDCDEISYGHVMLSRLAPHRDGDQFTACIEVVLPHDVLIVNAYTEPGEGAYSAVESALKQMAARLQRYASRRRSRRRRVAVNS